MALTLDVRNEREKKESDRQKAVARRKSFRRSGKRLIERLVIEWDDRAPQALRAGRGEKTRNEKKETYAVTLVCAVASCSSEAWWVLAGTRLPATILAGACPLSAIVAA